MAWSLSQSSRLDRKRRCLSNKSLAGMIVRVYVYTIMLERIDAML